MEKTKIDPFHLRKVAGAFATGITIVSIKSAFDDVVAMTANSFVSVSLDPALVLFSVGKKAQMAQILEAGKSVGISVLNAGQEEVSNHFGGLPSNGPVTDWSVIDGCPVVKENLAWYATEVHSVIPAGDHDLVLCTVKRCERSDGNPLIYFNGYQKLSLKT